MLPLPRLWRSPYARFGHQRRFPNDLEDETLTAVEVYSDAELAAIAGLGFDGIWVHGQLRHLAVSTVFPEYGPHAAQHQAALRTLCARAARHGLRVYLYMQPPRGLNEEAPFWQAHPEVAGAPVKRRTDDGFAIVERSLCTSTAPVRAFLRESSERLFRAVPELGGAIFITASEFTSHCYGRHFNRSQPVACPRCAQRSAVEVVSELIQLLRDGIRAASAEAQIICWNWSWTMYEPAPCAELIARLPADSVLLLDFERGGRQRLGERERFIDEYSLAYAGPSEQFQAAHALAQARGLPVMAKLQLGTTHELATVPSLPLLGSLYAKAAGMRRLGVSGLLGCWTFGNFPSLNPRAFVRWLLAGEPPPRAVALTALAAEHYPGADAAGVAAAWEQFGTALEAYPFSIPFLYFTPLNYALVQPLRAGPVGEQSCGRSWLMDTRGCNYAESLRGTTLDEVITALGELAARWRVGAELLERAVAGCRAPHVQSELDTVWVAGHLWQSGHHLYQHYRLALEWRPEQAAACRRLQVAELANRRAALPRVARDGRLGFHSECQGQMFDAAMLEAAIAELARECGA
jgi:hypothetical protein